MHHVPHSRTRAPVETARFHPFTARISTCAKPGNLESRISHGFLRLPRFIPTQKQRQHIRVTCDTCAITAVLAQMQQAAVTHRRLSGHRPQVNSSGDAERQKYKDRFFGFSRVFSVASLSVYIGRIFFSFLFFSCALGPSLSTAATETRSEKWSLNE